MTLDQLYTQLTPHFPASRRKDMKTAVKVYAQALGAADPQQCPVALYQAPLPTIYRCIDAYLSAPRQKRPYAAQYQKQSQPAVPRGGTPGVAHPRGRQSVAPV